MINKITGERPQPILQDEPVDLSHNPPALELCEEVKRLTAEAREAMLLKSLAVSNEQCNDLVLRLNVRVEELTQQVKNVELYNERLERKLKESVEKLIDDVKRSNHQLAKEIEFSLNQITETVTEIERLVSTAMGKAIDSATKLLNDRVKDATDMAVAKINEGAEGLNKELRKTKEEIRKQGEEMQVEGGFRKFMFWATPILLFAQSITMALLLLR